MNNLTSLDGIEYNADMVDEATIKSWTSMTVPMSLDQVQPEEVSWLTKVMKSSQFADIDVAAFYDDTAVQAAVKEAVDYVKADPEFSQTLLAVKQSEDQVFQEMYESTKSALLAKAVEEHVATADFNLLKQIKMTTDDKGMFECQVEGKTLLRADTNTVAGKNIKIILQVAIVFLDIITIIMAAAGIMAESGSGIAKRFVKFASKIEGWFMQMMERFWAKLQPLITKIRSLLPAGESAKWVKVIKSAAREVANAIVTIIAWAKRAKKFDELKSAAKGAIGVMLSSGWKKFKACCQLIASLILLCVSGGTSLVLKIITLVVGLVSLLLDSIDLYDMTHGGAK
ncbi:MAG: hypothetical protein GY777_30585 [Candidatus Brocadiaceae bacterium]|nr:hypothetical protein [Candidatus Brocadiaceae bacterium]